jgi:hypothetical protein
MKQAKVEIKVEQPASTLRDPDTYMQRFSIYSKDPAVASPLVEFSMKRADIIAGIKAGTFPLEQVGALFKKASESIQHAINLGKAK